MSHISCSSCGKRHSRHHDCSCHCKSCGGSLNRDFVRDIRLKRKKIQHEVICFDSYNDYHSSHHCESHHPKLTHNGLSYHCSYCHKHREHCSCKFNQDYHDFQNHHSRDGHSASCSACGKRLHYCSCSDDCGSHHSSHVSPCADNFKVRLGGLTTGIEFRLRQLTGCIVKIRVSGGNGNENSPGNTAELGIGNLLQIGNNNRSRISDDEIIGRICLVGGNFVELDYVKQDKRNHHRKNDQHQVASLIIPINRIQYVKLLEEEHHEKLYDKK